MELKIISPKEGGFIQQIQWNNEELKEEIISKIQDYKTLVYTEDTIKAAKADRAVLNKLVKAIEDERKRIKKLCMMPVDQFELQVKEIVSLINEPIKLIDTQIKEVEEKKKAEKRQEIEELFSNIGFQNFVTFDSVFDEKWLNATVTINKIEDCMKNRMYQIGEEVATISRLPEFSFEALEIYKKSLDLTKAIQEGQRLSDIQKRKVAYEEEKRRKRQEEEAAAEAERNTHVSKQPEPEERVNSSVPQMEERSQLYTIDFRVTADSKQLEMLKLFMQSNHIQYGPVPKKGE